MCWPLNILSLHLMPLYSQPSAFAAATVAVAATTQWYIENETTQINSFLSLIQISFSFMCAFQKTDEREHIPSTICDVNTLRIGWVNWIGWKIVCSEHSSVIHTHARTVISIQVRDIFFCISLFFPSTSTRPSI